MDDSIVIMILVFLASYSSSASDLFPPGSLPTKSGYLPVSTTSESAMFYAFYEAENSTLPVNATPVVVWLQGGPGCSSMLGNFYELGPWRVNFEDYPGEPLSLRRNPAPWNRLFGLLFLDSPVGTGLSFAASPADIPSDQARVARHLYAALSAFLDSDPGFVSRPLYITGESYAGKYVPAIAHHILAERADGPVKLAGIAIGNGLTDPMVQVGTHAASAYYSGLVNARQRAELEAAQDEAVRLTRARRWGEARSARTRVLSMLENMTGLATLYDYTKASAYKDEMVEELLSSEGAKRALGARTDLDFEVCSDAVGSAMNEDVMKSVKHLVEYLVRNTRVLLYQGLYDLRDGVVSTEAWVRTMDWDGIGEFLGSPRRVWRVRRKLAGYVQTSGSLTNVVVSGAGHLVPADCPFTSQAMIEDWILETGLFAHPDQYEEQSLAPHSA